jgi:anti-anti-sigma factor
MNWRTGRGVEPFLPARSVTQSGGTMTVLRGPCSDRFCTLYIEGPLHVPVSHNLRAKVRTLLRRGERAILLDLGGVSRIDAGGVGELVRAYNMTVAIDGALRIVHTSEWVGEILKRVGLFDLFSGVHDTE